MTTFLLAATLLLSSEARAEDSALQELRAQAPASSLAKPPVAAIAGAPVRAAESAVPTLPAEFEIREHAIALTDTFSLKAGGRTLGTITEKILSLTKSFAYTDASGACVASARTRIFAWGTHVDVSDCSGRKIGAIKEQVFKSLFKIHTTYSILDAADREIAVSEKMDWISTSVTLRTPAGGAVATLRRSWLNLFSDTWTVKVSNAAAVDSRLFVMIAAYKTSVDNDRRSEAAAADRRKKQEDNRSR